MLRLNAQQMKVAGEDAGPVGPLPEGWYKMRIVKATDEIASTEAHMLVLVTLVKVEGFKRAVRRHFRLVYLNSDGNPNPVGAKVAHQVADATDAINGRGDIDERLMVGDERDPKGFYGYIGVQPGSNGYGAKNDLQAVQSSEPGTEPPVEDGGERSEQDEPHPDDYEADYELSTE